MHAIDQSEVGSGILFHGVWLMELNRLQRSQIDDPGRSLQSRGDFNPYKGCSCVLHRIRRIWLHGSAGNIFEPCLTPARWHPLGKAHGFAGFAANKGHRRGYRCEAEEMRQFFAYWSCYRSTLHSHSPIIPTEISKVAGLVEEGKRDHVDERSPCWLRLTAPERNRISS